MVLAAYTSTWINDFEDIKSEIENGLHGLSFTIEHVGSTSVPMLDAKPIIDIDLVYAQPSAFEKIKGRLEKMGYFHNGNQGIVDREVFKRNGKVVHELLDTIRHHLYVCPTESQALERHLLSRNFLRRNEWARIRYQQIKHELAERAKQDPKGYAALKELHVNEFIDAIVEEERQHISKGLNWSSGGKAT
jgi:GrpB-like predicted nucleotidyltransferase (UPF0157 family)